MTVSLIHGNALTIPLASSSVHLVVTSPPYFALRSYRDDGDHYDGQLGSEETPLHFLAALWAVMDECWRVLRDDGSCWVNLGDKFAGSGGHNNSGISGGPSQLQGRTQRTTDFKASRRQAPDRYNQNSGGLRPKSRMLLPHLFAAGCQYPWLRRSTEAEAGITPTGDPPQWICRMDAVWSKVNGLPESVQDRVRSSHEYWFHFVKSERYYSALDTIREDYTPTQPGRHDAGSPNGSKLAATPGRTPDGAINGPRPAPNPLGKLPGSVWEVATEPLLLPDDLPQHFAAFPSEFPRRLVLGWSPSGVCVRCGEGRRPVCEKLPSGNRDLAQRSTAHYDTAARYGAGNGGNGGLDRLAADLREGLRPTITGTACACPTPDAPTRPSVVVDPFSGTGTTAIVASALGRHGVGVDLSWDYHRIARWRDGDGGLRAKALGVAKPEKQLDGQLSLLGEAGS